MTPRIDAAVSEQHTPTIAQYTSEIWNAKPCPAP
jgi:hypothetical protein